MCEVYTHSCVYSSTLCMLDGACCLLSGFCDASLGPGHGAPCSPLPKRCRSLLAHLQLSWLICASYDRIHCTPSGPESHWTIWTVPCWALTTQHSSAWARTLHWGSLWLLRQAYQLMHLSSGLFAHCMLLGMCLSMVGSFELGSDRVRSLNLCLAPSIVHACKACCEDAQCLDESGAELFFQELRPRVEAAWQAIQHHFVSVVPQGYQKPKTVLPKDQLKPLCRRLIEELDLLSMPADEDPETGSLSEEAKQFMRHMQEQTPKAGWTADTFGPAFLRCFGSRDAKAARLRLVNGTEPEAPSELALQAWEAASCIALTRFQSSPEAPLQQESAAQAELEEKEKLSMANEASKQSSDQPVDVALGTLLEMGFDRDMGRTALQLSNGDVQVWCTLVQQTMIQSDYSVVIGCDQSHYRRTGAAVETKR